MGSQFTVANYLVFSDNISSFFISILALYLQQMSISNINSLPYKIYRSGENIPLVEMVSTKDHREPKIKTPNSNVV